jgi:6-phosphogluconolactonase
MRGTLIIYKDPEEVANRVADQLMEWIAQSTGERFDMAISGGSTPNLLFAALASKYPASILWQKTHFWWVDERMVSPNDLESNFGNARQLLLSKIQIPAENIHRIQGEKEPVPEAESYALQIRREVGSKEGWPRFDLIQLGLGEDGHTASIFPNQMGLLHSDHICEVASHPDTYQQRITLTGKTINNASKIVFLVTGSNKSERLFEIWSGNEQGKMLPAFYIQPVNGELLWMTDRKAAALLP